MPAPLLRKKKTEKTYDPVSAEVWAAAARATACVVEVFEIIAINGKYGDRYKPLCDQLAAATALTPCAQVKEVRTQPGAEWTFDDYLMAVRVAQTLREIVITGVDFVPTGEFSLFDALREKAANAIIDFNATIETYTKLVKRERAMERLSGRKSRRRR